MKSVSEYKAIQAYLRHPGAELGKFVVGQLLVDHLGDHSDDLPVNSGLHNRDGEVIYRVIFLTGPPLKMSLDWPPP